MFAHDSHLNGVSNRSMYVERPLNMKASSASGTVRHILISAACILVFLVAVSFSVQAENLQEESKTSDGDIAQQLLIKKLTESLTRFEEKYGKDSLQVAHLLFGMSKEYLSQERYVNAEKTMSRALSIFRKHDEDLHLRRITIATHDLAKLNADLGNYSRSEQFYREAIRFRKKLHGRDHLAVAVTKYELGQLYMELGQYHRAESYLVSAHQTLKKLRGRDENYLIGVLNNLSIVYSVIGPLRKAANLSEQSVQLAKDRLGGNHAVVTKVMSNLGDIYRKQGRYVESERLFNQALDSLSDKDNKERSEIPSTLILILIKQSLLYEDMGLYEKAQESRDRALSIARDDIPEGVFP